MSGRRRQLDTTRSAILDAFLELAHDGNAVNISIPAVADAAGVSIRTVYRHFPSKDELQTAAAFRMSEQVVPTVGFDEVDESNVDTYLEQLWTGFAAQIPAVLAEHTTPAGRELRRTRLPASRAAVARAMPDIRDGVRDEELVDLVVAVTSSSMFLELVERMGHPPQRAAAMAHRLVQLLYRSTQGHRSTQGDRSAQEEAP